MHTFRKNGKKYKVLFVGERGADVVYETATESEAMVIVSFLNGGSYPPFWNPM